MKLLRAFFLAFFLLALCHAFATETSPTRGRLDLDGLWDFATDPTDSGETEGWYKPGVALPTDLPEGYAPKTGGKIQVPGIWDAQGYGVENDKVKHNFVGKGWYKREITVPRDWNREDSIFLTLGGISRSARVWLDGKEIGPEAIGCIGSFEWNVSSFLSPGQKSTLVICVDSSQHWETDPLLGAAALNDYLEIKWGGLWGHVYLESRPKTRLDSIYLRTKLNYDDSNNVVGAACIVDATILDELKTANFDGILKLEIFDKSGSRIGSRYADVKLDLSSGSEEVSLLAPVPGAKLWTPDAPYLYKARVTLYNSNGSGASDVLETPYGMREIKFVGTQILLNGKPFYLRGYGDDHIYPHEFSMPTDIAMYRERLKLIKSFGFNHCRHHSAILPHEYYDACDELGMLPNGEMLLGYPPQIPGEGSLWKNNVPEGTDPTPAMNTLKERWAQVVKEYRNHPSIFIWVGGNELCMLDAGRWSQLSLGQEMMNIAKKLDPDRYFTDCDGDFLNEYVTKGGRPGQEFYSILFDEWSNPLKPGKFANSKPFDKPSISHESGNFLTFSRPDQIDLFKDSNYKPFWMVDGKAKLAELGLSGETESWALASEQLYLLLHKYNIEGIRLNKELSGYHWWLFQDYWTTSNGIVDLFFRPKSLKPKDFIPFNNDVVLLQEGLKFTYVSGDKATVQLKISNFAPNAKSGIVSWSLLPAGIKNAKTNWFDNVTITDAPQAPNGQLTTLGSIEITCPPVERPTQAIFTLKYQADDKTYYTNSWTTYVFPQTIKPLVSRPIYADENTIELLPKEWQAQPLPESTDALPSDAIYAVDWISSEILNAVERGAGLLHLGGEQIFSSIPIQFQQTWWKAGDSEFANNTGTYVYSNAITNEVVDHNFCGAAWTTLLDGARKFKLEAAQSRPSVIIRALSSLVLVQDTAILFEFGVGKGKIIVSGLNHEASVESPLSQWILARSLEELGNGAEHAIQWDAKKLIQFPVVPDGVTFGVSRVVKSAESSHWNSYRSLEEDQPNRVCRQDKIGNELVIKTAVPSSTESATTTFIFAGCLGYATTPKTSGFQLSFNGAPFLQFDVIETFDNQTRVFEWKNADGTGALQFYVKKELPPNDKYGIFLLTVPTQLIKPNRSQEIAVSSLGEGSRRWFAVNMYADFSDILAELKSVPVPELTPV